MAHRQSTMGYCTPVISMDLEKEEKFIKRCALAPMAGVADRAFRELCMRYGAAFCTGEMVSVKGIGFEDEKSLALMEISDRERPVGIQLFGAEPEDFIYAARRAATFHPDFIDINMGCPTPKIVKNGGGSALLRDPKRCGEIVRRVRENCDVPVTVKIRKGWDNTSVNAPEVAKICEEAGCAAITVHGRTREQMYAPPVDASCIAAVRRAVSIPVIGNGDIGCGADAVRMLQETGCAALAVGRGALGRPWVFAEINAYLRGEPFTEPDIRERMAVMLEHVSLICQYKGDRIGIREARKHAVWYTKGLRGGGGFRKTLSVVGSIEELKQIAARIIAENS